MVRGLTPERLLERLDARPADPPCITGATDLYEHWMHEWDEDAVVGVFAADGWAVAFEPDAGLCIDSDSLARLSEGSARTSRR